MEHPDIRLKRNIYYLLLALALVIGVSWATSLTYVNDDCFVSFRYAKNFLNGLGLVYNAGERVEGYSNFLWTMLIAFGMKLGFDPIRFSTIVGICFFGLTLLLYGYLSWIFKEHSRRQYLWIPLTTLALCLHRDMNAHATSGMETSMFTFLISSTYCLLLTGRSGKNILIAGIIFVLAMMTRPDGILFLLCGVFYLIMTRKDFTKPLVHLILPSIAIFLPYWLWRYQYFGFFFPNTFYAKSINLDYYSQGLRYAWLYLETYPIYFVILPLALAGLWKLIRVSSGKPGILSPWLQDRLTPPAPHPILLASLYIIVYSYFIVRIGGDFMFARFFIPVTPMVYFLIERLLNRYTSNVTFLALAAIVLFMTYFRNDQYKDNVFVGYVADEKQYFTSVEPLEQSQRDAGILKKYFNTLPVRVAFYAGQLRLIYYLEPAFAVESSSGLTDTAIAHQSITTRERPGHEKHPTLEYLMKRRINFYIGPTDPIPPGQLVLNAISFGSFRARIITYDDRIMAPLAGDSTVTFVRLPKYLDEYISDMPSYTKQKVAHDYLFLKGFYFEVNDDKRREHAFLQFLQEK